MIQKVLDAMLRDCTSRNLSSHTIEFYETQCEVFINFCKGKGVNDVDNVTADLIREYLTWLHERHNEGGVHAKYRAMKVLLLWYEREFEPYDWKNPINKIRPPKVPDNPIEPITIEQVTALFRECKNTFSGVRDRSLLYFMLDTGARVEEITMMLFEDLNLYDGSILIRRGKGGKPRLVYFGMKTARALKKYLKIRADNNPSLFVTSIGTTLAISSIQGMLARRCARLGIPIQFPHTFRKAFTTAMSRETDVFNLMRLTGDKTMEVLNKHYVKKDDDVAHAAHRKGSPVDKLL